MFIEIMQMHACMQHLSNSEMHNAIKYYMKLASYMFAYRCNTANINAVMVANKNN